MSYITSVGTAVPANKFEQTKLANFMVRAMQLKYEDGRKLNTIFRASGITYRHSVLDDYGQEDSFTFYSNTKDFEPFPSTGRRIDEFRKHALPLSVEAANNALGRLTDFNRHDITHLVVVCCTGMYAPGLDIDLVKSLGLASTVQRTCITFMGCYAAFNALKVADAFCRTSDKTKVLVVCTELCTLHFQKTNTDDNLLANALFADGSAAVVVEASTKQKLKLVPRGFESDLLTDGEQDMAWTVGNMGFEMKLSSYVPTIIKSGIRALTSRLMNTISSELHDIKYFAIHPGGKKILEVIEKELAIDRKQNEPAYNILANFGNMSSPTVLFVLHDIFKKLEEQDHGKKILSFAFGPGLTLESTVLEIVYE